MPNAVQTTSVLDQPWWILTPELIIVAVATIISIIDMFMGPQRDRRFLGWFSIVGLIAAFVAVVNFLLIAKEPITSLFNDMIRLDPFASMFKLLILLGSAFVMILAVFYTKNKILAYRGEFYYLILTATLGAMIMVSSADLITLFIGLELLSISSYIMVGLKKNSLKSNESAFKYVVSGGIATAFFLYGASFIYGLSGTTNIYEIRAKLGEVFLTNANLEVVLYLAFIFLFVGLAFKIAAAPFHMWAPDVYEGSPSPVAAFLAVVSKIAGVAFIIRLFFTIFTGVFMQNPTQLGLVNIVNDYLSITLSLLAAITMIIGSTLALKQTNIKRMMAYSGISHAGFLLVPLASVMAIDQIYFYLFAYLFAAIGAFAIITLVSSEQGHAEISGFAGLYHRSPLLALAMTIFLLSLAGLPITAGFFGKFYVFIYAFSRELYLLAAIMIATSVISFYYYFNVIVQMYLRRGQESSLNVPFSIASVIIITVGVTVAVGLQPNIIINFMQNFNLFPN